MDCVRRRGEERGGEASEQIVSRARILIYVCFIAVCRSVRKGKRERGG